jgi:bifunctional non-homologous end joining protein LigD
MSARPKAASQRVKAGSARPRKDRAKPSPKSKRAADPLAAYHKKRDFAQTAEPAGKATKTSGKQPRFVIQKHDATRLHYDLRLEMDGVFRSWAVPKGLPTKTGAKVLAVEVEDHPLDYGNFEGTIPEGNYGAGTVQLWDRGHYTVEGGLPEAAYRAGKIHFTLAGEKCRGEWTLVRMRAERRKVNWLVIKNRDTAAAAAPASADRDRSVLTGRTMDEIAADAPKRAQPKAAARPATRVRPRRANLPKVSADKRGERTIGPPEFVEPMKALGVTQVPAGSWRLEIKLDGYRALAVLAGGAVQLWSRNKNLLGDKYPEVVEALARLRCSDAILDGEVVALDAQGRSRFQLLQNLDGSTDRPPIRYYVFDLLRLNGRSLTGKPIEARRDVLEKLMQGAPDALQLSPVFDLPPDQLLREVARQGLEGIIAKEPGSPYEPGRRSGRWLKYRLARDQEFVIGGYTPPRGSRPYFGAILVGYYEGGQLMYAGKVGTGFDTKRLASLSKLFAPLKTDSCAFANLPMPQKPRYGTGMTKAEMREVTWLAPKLVCQVRFSEWTREGMLRQPVFLGLREDKPARDVRREEVAEGNE